MVATFNLALIANLLASYQADEKESKFAQKAGIWKPHVVTYNDALSLIGLRQITQYSVMLFGKPIEQGRRIQLTNMGA